MLNHLFAIVLAIIGIASLLMAALLIFAAVLMTQPWYMVVSFVFVMSGSYTLDAIKDIYDPNRSTK